MNPISTILHLGLGSFHRAHQALYLQKLHDINDAIWVLAGGNIRPDMEATIATLQASGGAYTLETISPSGAHEYKRITSIANVISWTENLSGLIAVGADPSTKIISFTVTEAGYYLTAGNKLDISNKDIQSDLTKAAKHQAGSTLYGALTAILRARIKANAGPITLLNCDNLRHNGDCARSGLLQFIRQLNDPALLEWVNTNTSSPNAMVDRITPRPTADVVQRVAAATGIHDAAAVMGEHFIQWVIEDRFIAGRPDWQRVGVELVASVDAYEEAKIRLLNATHSCIAWAGTLRGLLYIHEGTRNATIRQFAFDYVTNDVIPVLDTLEEPCPINLENYRDTVLERFCNVAIQDTNQRVAMDGFSKIPGFIAPTIRERLAQQQPIDSVAMLPALFLQYLQQWHHQKLPYTYQDQVMNVQQAHAICEAVDPVAAFCSDTTLWGEMANDARLVSAIRRARQRVIQFEATPV
jgi:D-arabinitol 4-dehydrogenase